MRRHFEIRTAVEGLTSTSAELFLRDNDLIFYCSKIWVDLCLLLQNPFDSEHERSHITEVNVWMPNEIFMVSAPHQILFG